MIAVVVPAEVVPKQNANCADQPEEQAENDARSSAPE